MKNKNQKHTCESCGKRSRSCKNVVKHDIGQKWLCPKCVPVILDSHFPAPILSSKPRLLSKHPSAYLKKALGQLNLQHLQTSEAAAIWGHLADKLMAKLKTEGQNQIEPNIIMATVFSLNARPEILRNISEQRMSGVFGCSRSSLQNWKNRLYPVIGERKKLG